MSVLEPGAEIDFESLPLAKITHYPLEPADYKPYAQGALCLAEDKIGLRLSSFEVEPPQESEIGLVLFAFPENSGASLNIWATPAGVKAFVIAGETETAVKIDAHHREGEDLQGKFWGYDIFINNEELAMYGRLVNAKDSTVKGNFFKVSKGGRPHCGAYDLADFIKDEPLYNEKMSEFKLVLY